MLEEAIVRYASPTLAGLKTGSLFSHTWESREGMIKCIRELNHRLVKRGLKVVVLRFCENRGLVYIFRPSRLRYDLAQPATRSFLENFCYPVQSPDRCLVTLKRRLREQDEFPHEIGVFLGYPVEDVRGFMEQKAENCHCVGFWKVYGNREKAEMLFSDYRRCKRNYFEHWKKERSLEQLIVSG